ncbi:hypothetical protein V6U90_30155 [Micromonospora sp. CPCC 206060]|uniref:hypothetical protein n=1 Tax=Micromonospora sp. CPCC 206060 TaxID=3122406 RepID=UPI002FF14A82
MTPVPAAALARPFAAKLLVILDGAQVLAAALGTDDPKDHMIQLAEQLLAARLPTAVD